MNLSLPCFAQISFSTTCNLLGLSYPPHPAEMVGRKKMHWDYGNLSCCRNKDLLKSSVNDQHQEDKHLWPKRTYPSPTVQTQQPTTVNHSSRDGIHFLPCSDFWCFFNTQTPETKILHWDPHWSSASAITPPPATLMLCLIQQCLKLCYTVPLVLRKTVSIRENFNQIN